MKPANAFEKEIQFFADVSLIKFSFIDNYDIFLVGDP